MGLKHIGKGDLVLITGGTGSFGRAMVDYLLARGVENIRIFSRDEAKQDVMRQEYANTALRFHIGDVRLRDSVDAAMNGVKMVFHAAALKQVPSCEFFPLEAVRTNIIGSANVIQSAVSKGVEQVVCLSTDKAVMPVNAMGMTKALMEKTAQALTREMEPGETIVSSVRYGNVMCSRGSVIPLFIKQILSGQPLTITEPSMTRFMLALPQAVELVDFAFGHARQGDVFVRKAPACSVMTLAQVLLDIFAADNEIRVIGMRHGEKLHETLVSAEELCRAEQIGNYYRVSLDTRDLNYSKYFTEGELSEASTADYDSSNTHQLGHSELKDLLLSLPEVKDAMRSGSN